MTGSCIARSPRQTPALDWNLKDENEEAERTRLVGHYRPSERHIWRRTKVSYSSKHCITVSADKRVITISPADYRSLDEEAVWMRSILLMRANIPSIARDNFQMNET